MTSKIRIEIAAFGGLLLLGMLKIVPISDLFSGFSNPTLFTVMIVLIMSEGIIESGIFVGFGKNREEAAEPQKQVLLVSIWAWAMSVFINNVGVINLVTPTVSRMSKRAKVETSAFGLPVLYATFLGGSVTLISIASNLIVSSFRQEYCGQPFGMFDFAFHGIAMSVAALLLWFAKKKVRTNSMSQQVYPEETLAAEIEAADLATAVRRQRRNTLVILSTLIPAILLSSFGVSHPAILFGIVIFLWVALDIYKLESVMRSINIPVMLYLGSMLSISEILNKTGALPNLVDAIIPKIGSLPPLALILVFLFLAVALSNITDNSVSALLMSPAAILLIKSGATSVSPDALLMAIAAGAGLGIILPTHRATYIANHNFGIQKKSFIKQGAVIAFCAGISAALIIYFIWN